MRLLPQLKHSPSPSKLKEQLTETRYALQEFAEMMVWAVSRHNYMEFAQYQDWQCRKFLKEEREWLYELKRRKWIETKTIGDRVMACLTEKGWQQALRDRVRHEKKKCANGVCIIIFDIPENKRHIRNHLRLFLKECGFIKLQHSVWMTDKDVTKSLLLLLQRHKLDKWIRIIQGTVLKTSTLDTLRARRCK